MPHTPGRTVEICHGSRPIAVISDRRSGHTSRAKIKQEPNLLPVVFPILGVRKMNVLRFSEVPNYSFESLASTIAETGRNWVSLVETCRWHRR